jgi:AcrR family transcriptional regulator
MGYKHDKEEILEAALEASLADGVASLTYGRLARQMDITDRMIVYYYPTKADLIGAVLEEYTARLMGMLSVAFSEPASDHVDMLRAAWPYLADPAADPMLRMFFELVGLSARGLEPYATLVPPAFDAWAELIAGLFTLPEEERRAEAEATIALLDGLLMVRQILGPEAGERAARRHGLLDTTP